MDKTQVELLKSILNTIEKHPNAKVSKLIKGFEVERTPQNIALLLIELAEHPEFSADTTISLKYYLDCFRKLDQEPTFAEAGIVLFNSSKIYAKRVDHIHQEIERLILSLSNVENTETVNPEANNTLQSTVKEKRGKKRTLEQINGPYEANMSAKRIKMLSSNKRFDNAAIHKRSNTLNKTPVHDVDKTTKNYTPQATWQYSLIEDFDYEDEADSKKNYKLFTYHLEHRYNTLIPDINFKMYFKIKDFIDEACNDSDLPQSWPPLSDAYIEQYLNLEDVILVKEGHLEKTKEKLEGSRFNKALDLLTLLNNKNTEKSKSSQSITDSGIEFDLNSSFNDAETQLNISENNPTPIQESQSSLCESNLTTTTRNASSDSGIELETTEIFQVTVLESNGDSLSKTNEISKSPEICKLSSTANENEIQTNGEAAMATIESDPTLLEATKEIQSDPTLLEATKDTTQSDATLLDATQVIQSDPTLLEATKATTQKDPTLLDPSNFDKEDISSLKIILPYLSDEAIYMSDLDEKDRQMLSPSVVTQDVFRCVKDKSNIVIKVDEAIEHLFKIKEPSPEFFSLPLYERPEIALLLNILKIPLKHFNKRRRFKLGPEFDLPKKERLKKYVRRSSLVKCPAPRKLLRFSDTVVTEHISPAASPSYEPDWLGFPEDSLMDKSRTLSRDSGISLHQTDDFMDSSDLLSSTLKPIALDEFGCSQPQSEEKIESTTNVPAAAATATELPVPLVEQLSQNIQEIDKPSEEGEIIQNNDTNSHHNTPEDNQIDEVNEENRIRTKVHQWHSHLQPILACSRERHHFDVFAIGTEIMTQFDRSDVCSENVSFMNVMEEKEESLISRYFLSMLLLANQGNIRIDVQNKNTNGPSELHDIRLKLMSRKRNIVSLEDNIGLNTQTTPSTATTTTTQIDKQQQQSAVAIVRTLKSVPEVPKMDDRDSGVAMSEESIAS